MARWWMVIGSLMGFIAVAGGAFGAHALKTRIAADMLAVFDTGTRYLMFQATALLLVGVLSTRPGAPSYNTVGWLFTIGTLIFTGSLWALAISGVRTLGAITPFGGLCLLAGWVALGLLTARLAQP
jgi:uncharacterized membrane protein YgdD (TMEM256/DUF423 family)